MERIVQYLDELEDLVCAVLTLRERIRRALQFVAVIATSVSLQVLGVMLALAQPPLALATVSLMVVGMLYKSVVSPAEHRLVLP